MKCCKIFGSIALFGIVILSPAYACIQIPSPFYEPPPYVDPGYEPANSVDTDYGPTHKFLLLMRDYADKGVGVSTAEEGNSNNDKSRQEARAYSDAIVQLLKTKNIAAPAEPFVKDIRECESNTRENALAFMRAAFEDSSVTDGFAAFVKIRDGILQLCNLPEKGEDSTINDQIHSERDDLLGRISADLAKLHQAKGTGAYPDYLDVLLLLYGKTRGIGEENMPKALELLRKIQNNAPRENWLGKRTGSHPNSTWLHQTASYLVARLQLIMSQKDWDGETMPPAIDAALLSSAKAAYADYLKQYPDGLYAKSAKNIERKILLLEGKQDALNREVEAAVSSAFNRTHFSQADFDAAIEALNEYKLHHGDIHVTSAAPLLAAYGLFRKAYDTPEGEKFPSELLGELQARKKDFDQYPGLFDFLQAFVLFEQREFAKLVELTPHEPATGSIASLSTDALRARALEALGKKEDALALWKHISNTAHDSQSQLHLAALYIATNNLAGLFGKNSGIEDARIFSDFSYFALSDAQLWTVLKFSSIRPTAHNAAENALFRRLLLKRNYASIEKLGPEGDAGNDFRKIGGAIAALAQNPKDAAALTHIGAYIREHYWRPDASVYGEYNPFGANILEELKPVCPICTPIENATPPFEDFRKAEEIFHKSGQKSEAEAEALHYLVMCFRKFEPADRCRWGGNFQNQGKKWFGRLHSNYPDSEWAKKTPYFYTDE